ncbi:MAG: alpha/beta hydrolase [Armatimonadetes bacterium]|nr:alpha/beta hydrolase [Armatimonadota bacterium]
MRFDEIYASIDGANLRYNAILPDSTELSAAVVCIHGGGWVSGDRNDMNEVARYFADHGYAAFSPQYRLAPLHPYPAAIEDGRTFLAFLRENSDKLGVRSNAIGVIGNSAGGHLSALLGTSTDPQEKADAVVNISGLVDLTDPNKHHPQISWDFIGQFMGAPFAQNSAAWIEASPLYQVRPSTSPMLIIHGSDDDIVWPDQSKRLKEALDNVGVENELIILDGEGHSFAVQGFETILDRALGFFDAKLRSGALK